MSTITDTKPAFDFQAAALRLKNVAIKTPLQYNRNLSKKYKCNVYLKREDLKVVRSYKMLVGGTACKWRSVCKRGQSCARLRL